MTRLESGVRDPAWITETAKWGMADPVSVAAQRKVTDLVVGVVRVVKFDDSTGHDIETRRWTHICGKVRNLAGNNMLPNYRHLIRGGAS